ncbi:unnamed protein product [Cylicocyclus nassatus]|uniref:Phosphatidylcholine 2-acylhydrolase n=1 Tax=Cylicocyclus nassatus TaxID=53992 RepID=A0AA36GXK6_CYLNA|nr:unnamed protein product [Cylicocyclus nassatus]
MMSNLLCFSILILATLFVPVLPSFANLAKMILDVLKVNPFKYYGYGCYCGPFTGHITDPPVDAVDECCLLHDHCYSDTKKDCGWKIWRYATDYSWTFDQKTKKIECTSWKWRTCARALCACDVRLVKCLAYKRLIRGKKKCTINEYAKRWMKVKDLPLEAWYNQSLYYYYMTSGKYRRP